MVYKVVIGRGEQDKKLFGDEGLIFLGKGYVKMGQYTTLSNELHMDVARSHAVLVAGKRGSGKSYTLGVMMEEIANLPKETGNNLASVIFDTMGIFWTMKFRNEKDKELLTEWNLKTQTLPVRVLVPFGFYEEYRAKGMPIDTKFAIDPQEMLAEDWILTFGLAMTDPIAVTIQRAIATLQEKKFYSIQDIMEFIEKDKRIDERTKNATLGLFDAANTWGVFAREKRDAVQIKDLVRAGEMTVLDLSAYNSIGAFNVRALVISVLSRKIFSERLRARKKEEVDSVSRGLEFKSSYTQKDEPLVWLFIDEAHEFLPKDEKTVATDALIQILREGRQPGISIVLATQQPGKIHNDVMTQSDIVIAHRVTAEQDVSALNEIMQSYVLDSIKKQMDELPHLKGSALILDDNSERIYPIRIRPRFTWHGGEAPSAVEPKKKFI